METAMAARTIDRRFPPQRDHPTVTSLMLEVEMIVGEIDEDDTEMG